MIQEREAVDKVFGTHTSAGLAKEKSKHLRAILAGIVAVVRNMVQTFVHVLEVPNTLVDFPDNADRLAGVKAHFEGAIAPDKFLVTDLPPSRVLPTFACIPGLARVPRIIRVPAGKHDSAGAFRRRVNAPPGLPMESRPSHLLSAGESFPDNHTGDLPELWWEASHGRAELAGLPRA
jgi:hypothetical protein